MFWDFGFKSLATSVTAKEIEAAVEAIAATAVPSAGNFPH